MIYNLWNRVGLFLFLFVCLFLFLLLDFFRLLYKSLQKEHCSKDNEKVLDLKRQTNASICCFVYWPQICKGFACCGITEKPCPCFLSTPHVNNATFQRINFVKLKFIWISLNIFKKNKYAIDINIGAYLLFLSIQKE